jgi:hypothetical protein
MKTIKNLTSRPLKIRLGGGKTLHLGPWKTGQVSDAAAADASVRKLVDGGEVEIVGEGAAAAGEPSGPSGVQESTHGHRQSTVVRPKGNR